MPLFLLVCAVITLSLVEPTNWQAGEETKADDDAEVAQARDFGGPVIDVCVNSCDCSKEEVEEAVDKGHVDGENDDDRGEEEHSEWTRHA
jgi:hypothetical protein